MFVRRRIVEWILFSDSQRAGIFLAAYPQWDSDFWEGTRIFWASQKMSRTIFILPPPADVTSDGGGRIKCVRPNDKMKMKINFLTELLHNDNQNFLQ